MEIVCVLDLDETLGFYEDGVGFHKRPYADFLMHFLKFSGVKFMLWSYGDDAYVKLVINSFVLNLREFAFRVWGRTQCEKSKRLYSVVKCSEHIRKSLKNKNVFLIGIDDRVNEMMDNRYNLRIFVEPYKSQNSKDIELVAVMEKIVTHLNGI